MVTSSSSIVYSGLLKWYKAAMAAIQAQSVILPSWSRTRISTLMDHTFSPAIIHKPSVSIALLLLKAFSSNLLTITSTSESLSL